MKVEIISVLLVSQLTLGAYLYCILKRVRAEYDELKFRFEEVDEAEMKFEGVCTDYQSLQKTYARDRKDLRSLDAIVDQYNIGVGSVDVEVYERIASVESLEALKKQLENTKDEAKRLVREKRACLCQSGNDWAVGGSIVEGRKLVNREVRLRLRCFDNEVKAAKALVNWNNINRLICRLNRAFDEINARGKMLEIEIQRNYRDLKILELKITFEVNQLKAELKEVKREEKRVEGEAVREKARIIVVAERLKEDRERLEKLVQEKFNELNLENEEQRELLELHRKELDVLKLREQRAVSMAQQTRAGYVYVISNELSFGVGMIKIGMTRRVDPYDRVKELGDASVPDTFDVHAIFYSEDAPTLEKQIHHAFAEQRVNLVNRRKEFFYTSPASVINFVQDANCRCSRVV